MTQPISRRTIAKAGVWSAPVVAASVAVPAYAASKETPGVQYGVYVSVQNNGGYVGYARGTSNAQAGLAWVGENGPELIRFRGGEQVVPNSRLAEEAGGRKYVFAPTYYDDGRSVRRDFEDWRHALGMELV